MNKSDHIYVAGHTGLVGSAIVRKLRALGHDNLLLRTHEKLDLCDQAATERFFEAERPVYAFLAAGLVGGIGANMTKPGSFIRTNLQIQTNVITSARHYECQKILFLGSSCIYPRECRQPMREEDLFSGPLEPTNSAYAVAKLAGIEMLAAYRAEYGLHSVVANPTNLFGPGDSYDPADSHVLPALLRRFHLAKETGAATVTLWGNGRARREFLHVDDCAAACVLLMGGETEGVYNVGSGEERTIAETACAVAEVIGYRGRILFDGQGADGMPRKLLDSSRLLALGWKPGVPFTTGVAATYQAMLAEGT